MRRRNFQLAIDTAFADSRMTEEITLNGKTLRAFVEQFNFPEGDFRTDAAESASPGWIMSVRLKDCPNKPSQGDPIVRKGENYHVQSSEIDSLGMYWDIDVDKG